MLPERMHRVMLLVRNEDRQDAIRELAKARAIHVVDHKKEVVSETTIDIGSSAEAADILSDTLTKTRSLLAKLPHTEGDVEEPSTLSERIVRINQLADLYADHEQAIAELDGERQEIEEQRHVLELLPDFEGPVSGLFRTDHVQTVLVEGDTERLTVVLDPIFVIEGEATLIGVTGKHDLDDVIKASECKRVDLSPVESLKGTLDEARDHVRERLAVLQHEMDHARQEMEALGKHTEFLQKSERKLQLELLKAQAPLHFGTTERVTLIQGYVPTSKRHQIEESLPQAVMSFSETNEAPTRLHNPKLLESFEEFLTLYTLPKYHEIDPTSVLAVTFPVFFGFMLGDIGYGLVMLLLFLWIHHRFQNLRAFSEIVMVSAVSTIIFGALFGEIFGLETLWGFHLPALIHRAEHVNEMIIVSILFGVAHINLGLLFGMKNLSHEGWFYAIIEKGSWVLVQVGIVLALAAYGYLPFPAPAWSGWTLIGLSVAGIAYSERLKGLMELPMILSHTLSYARLAAIGLASLSMAAVVNDLGGGLVTEGGLAFVGGLLIILIGHTINLGLGLLGPFLHSLRLHYVEFFMKFYEGGGTPYVPFGTIRGD